MKRLSLKWKALWGSIVVFIPIFLFGYFTVGHIYAILLDHTSQLTASLIDKAGYDIELAMNERERDTVHLLYDNRVKALLSDTDAPAERASLEADMKAITRERFGDDPALSGDILLVSKNMKVLASSYAGWQGRYRMLGTEWIDKIMRAGGERVDITGYSVSKWGELGHDKVVSIARALYVDGEYAGFLLVDVPVMYLETICGGINFGQGGFLVLLDSDQYVVFSTNTMDMGSRFALTVSKSGDKGYEILPINRQEMFLVTYRSESTGMTVIGALPLESIQRALNTLRGNLVLIIVAIGCVVALVAFAIMYGISHPILSLTWQMKQVGKGELSIRVKTNRQDEIGFLQNGFNRMLDQVEEMLGREYEAGQRAKQAQLNEMTSLINPHFMYNTLEAISMTAYMNGDNDVVQMLVLLARMFRSMTGRASKYISIGEELQHCREYLQLIRMRGDMDLQVEFDCEEGVEALYTLGLVLQPMLENSLQHGLKDRKKGRICVRALRREKNVILSLEDDGQGMSAERMDYVRGMLQNREQDEFEGSHALMNVNSRLRLAFGEPYGLAVWPGSGGGLRVELLIPVLEHPERG